MRVLDLFSGIGGFSLGLERAGMRTVAFCEIDPYCRAVLRKHWPDVPIFGDVRTLKGSDVGPIDLICGGFPCQPFSVAGKRGGAADDRHLWPEMLRLVAEVQPAWVIGENVAGLTSMVKYSRVVDVETRLHHQHTHGYDYERVEVRQEGMLFGGIVSDLQNCGYQVIPFVIPACAVDAPHRRDRVWIVAHRASDGWKQGITDGERCGSGNGPRQERGPWNGCGPLADAEQCQGGAGCEPDVLWRRTGEAEQAGLGGGLESLADADEPGPQEHRRLRECAGECASGAGGSSIESRWSPEPGVGRVAYGIPRRVDRLRALGNAVVPQVVEMIGRAIMECTDD